MDTFFSRTKRTYRYCRVGSQADAKGEDPLRDTPRTVAELDRHRAQVAARRAAFARPTRAPPRQVAVAENAEQDGGTALAVVSSPVARAVAAPARGLAGLTALDSLLDALESEHASLRSDGKDVSSELNALFAMMDAAPAHPTFLDTRRDDADDAAADDDGDTASADADDDAPSFPTPTHRPPSTAEREQPAVTADAPSGAPARSARAPSRPLAEPAARPRHTSAPRSSSSQSRGGAGAGSRSELYSMRDDAANDDDDSDDDAAWERERRARKARA